MNKILKSLRESFSETYVIPICTIKENWESKEIQTFILQMTCIIIPISLLFISVFATVFYFEIRSLAFTFFLTITYAALYFPMIIALKRFFEKTLSWF